MAQAGTGRTPEVRRGKNRIGCTAPLLPGSKCPQLGTPFLTAGWGSAMIRSEGSALQPWCFRPRGKLFKLSGLTFLLCGTELRPAPRKARVRRTWGDAQSALCVSCWVHVFEGHLLRCCATPRQAAGQTGVGKRQCRIWGACQFPPPPRQRHPELI